MKLSFPFLILLNLALCPSLYATSSDEEKTQPHPIKGQSYLGENGEGSKLPRKFGTPLNNNLLNSPCALKRSRDDSVEPRTPTTKGTEDLVNEDTPVTSLVRKQLQRYLCPDRREASLDALTPTVREGLREASTIREMVEAGTPFSRALSPVVRALWSRTDVSALEGKMMHMEDAHRIFHERLAQIEAYEQRQKEIVAVRTWNESPPPGEGKTRGQKIESLCSQGYEASFLQFTKAICKIRDEGPTITAINHAFSTYLAPHYVHILIEGISVYFRPKDWMLANIHIVENLQKMMSGDNPYHFYPKQRRIRSWQIHHINQEPDSALVYLPPHLHTADIHGFHSRQSHIDRSAFYVFRARLNPLIAKYLAAHFGVPLRDVLPDSLAT